MMYDKLTTILHLPDNIASKKSKGSDENSYYCST